MAVKEWFRRLQPVQLYLVLFFTSAFFIVELIASHITHSLTLLLNAYHMLCNIIALGGCIASVKYANREKCRGGDNCEEYRDSSTVVTEVKGSLSSLPAASKQHTCSDRRMKNTFGWARIDILTMLICCVFLASFCFKLLLEALQTLIHNSHRDQMHLPLVIMGIGITGIVLNIFCYIIIGGYTFNQSLFLKITSSGNVVLQRKKPANSAEGELQLSPTRTSPIAKPKGQGLMEIIRDVGGCIFVIIAAILVHFTHQPTEASPNDILKFIDLHKPGNATVNDKLKFTDPHGPDDATADHILKFIDPHVLGDVRVDDILKFIHPDEPGNAAVDDILKFIDPDEPGNVTVDDILKFIDPHEPGNETIDNILKFMDPHVPCNASLGDILKFLHLCEFDKPRPDYISKFIDPVMAIISSIFLFAMSYPYLSKSCMILLQTIPNHINIDSLKNELLAAFPGIVNVHDFHVWHLAGTKIISTVHIIYLDPTVYAAITDQVTAFFVEMGITQVTIQPEFHKPNVDKTDCLIRCRGKRCIQSQCCNEEELLGEIITRKFEKESQIVDKRFVKKEIIPAASEVDLRRFSLNRSDSTKLVPCERVEASVKCCGNDDVQAISIEVACSNSSGTEDEMIGDETPCSTMAF